MFPAYGFVQPARRACWIDKRQNKTVIMGWCKEYFCCVSTEEVHKWWCLLRIIRLDLVKKNAYCLKKIFSADNIVLYLISNWPIWYPAPMREYQFRRHTCATMIKSNWYQRNWNIQRLTPTPLRFNPMNWKCVPVTGEAVLSSHRWKREPPLSVSCIFVTVMVFCCMLIFLHLSQFDTRNTFSSKNNLNLRSLLTLI